MLLHSLNLTRYNVFKMDLNAHSPVTSACIVHLGLRVNRVTVNVSTAALTTHFWSTMSNTATGGCSEIRNPSAKIYETNCHFCRSMTDLPFLRRTTFRWEILPAKVRNRRDVLFSFEDFIGRWNTLWMQRQIQFSLEFDFFSQCHLEVLHPYSCA